MTFRKTEEVCVILNMFFWKKWLCYSCMQENKVSHWKAGPKKDQRVF